ncbi:hypothetical protein BGZ49_004742 [Haplosporangium sp. Z 27]|nr:hypothetical protein BGZ49_004742 [Haplosporangium sp. Z 27]
MKAAAIFLILVSLMASATAHMALLYPTPRGGYGTKQYNGRIHTFIGYKDSKWNMRFPCGGYAPGPVTKMHAGERIDVRFLASTMKAADIKKQPKPTSANHQFSQARHGGGTNVPSCTAKNQCLFVWSWTANILPQYYHNCVDITLTGVKNGKKPKTGIQVVDFKGHAQNVKTPGDGKNHQSASGPSKQEINDNLNGKYAV